MNKNKRDVLKGLAVGSVWATPVVTSVVLPVHATTSSTSCPGGCFQGFFGESPGPFLLFDSETGSLSVHSSEDSTCSGIGVEIDDYAIAETCEEALIVNPKLSCANLGAPAGACTIWVCAG